MSSSRSLVRDVLLLAPFVIILMVLGLLVYLVPTPFTLVLNGSWGVIVAFIISYVSADFLITRFARSEKFKRAAFVYGTVAGGIVSTLFLNFVPPIVQRSAQWIQISFVVMISIATFVLLLEYYKERSRIYASVPSESPATPARRKFYAAVYMIFLLGVALYVGSLLETPSTDFTQPVALPMSLDYPSYSNLGLVIGNPSATMHLDVALSADHTISENTPVSLTVTGNIGSTLVKKIATFSAPQLGSATIAEIKVGFVGAFEVHQNVVFPSNGPPLAGTLLILNRTLGCGVPPIGPVTLVYGPTTLCGILPTTITWPVEGDYSPAIIIFYANGSTVNKAYTDYKVHVTSSQIIQSENLNEKDAQISIGLAVAVLLFSFVEATRHISAFLKPKPTDDATSI